MQLPRLPVVMWLAVFGLGLALALTPVVAGQATPPPLPAWTPGTLDIHHIVTGRGNSTFFVFPDATTMLVDAGAVTSAPPHADPRPDGSRTPGAWIADYVRQMHPTPARPRLDYALITHFHADHFGDVTPAGRKDASGVTLTGITEVLDALGAGVVVDRAWPAYDYPSDLGADAAVANYRRYLDGATARTGLRVERARVGSASQFRVNRDPRWPDVGVRTVAANGEIWTGTGEGTEQTFPPLASIPREDHPDENMCSIALRVHYGRFDYFTGGDLPGDPEGAPAWQGVEARLGAVLGPTDVHQVNHHGSIDPATPAFLAALRSRVLIVPAWAPTHPSPDVLKRLLNTRYYPGPRDVFTLALREPMTHAIGARVRQLAASHGHVVVRVAAGGAAYSMFVLDDTTPARTVTATFGPYPAR